MLGLRKHFLMLGSSTPVLNQSSLQATYKKHEQLKRRHYDQRVREIEHGTFTPLVLSTTAGMGKTTTTSYKDLLPFSQTNGMRITVTIWVG